MNLNTPTINPGKLTAADFKPAWPYKPPTFTDEPQILTDESEFEAAHSGAGGDVPWPLLDSRKPWQRPAMTGIDIVCLLAVWCAGAVVIGLAGFGLVTIIKLLPGV